MGDLLAVTLTDISGLIAQQNSFRLHNALRNELSLISQEGQSLRGIISRCVRIRDVPAG